MSLTEKINEQLKEAMKAKDEARLRGLRAIKSALLLAEREKGKAGEISAPKEIQLLQKLAKQRKDSLEIYEKQNREDLAKAEKEELAVIEEFLPRQISEEEIRDKVRGIIVETGATSPSDMGKIMGRATKELAGKADNKKVAEIVKEELAKG